MRKRTLLSPSSSSGASSEKSLDTARPYRALCLEAALSQALLSDRDESFAEPVDGSVPDS